MATLFQCPTHTHTTQTEYTQKTPNNHLVHHLVVVLTHHTRRGRSLYTVSKQIYIYITTIIIIAQDVRPLSSSSLQCKLQPNQLVCYKTPNHQPWNASPRFLQWNRASPLNSSHNFRLSESLNPPKPGAAPFWCFHLIFRCT